MRIKSFKHQMQYTDDKLTNIDFQITTSKGSLNLTNVFGITCEYNDNENKDIESFNQGLQALLEVISHNTKIVFEIDEPRMFVLDFIIMIPSDAPINVNKLTFSCRAVDTKICL